MNTYLSVVRLEAPQAILGNFVIGACTVSVNTNDSTDVQMQALYIFSTTATEEI